MYEFFCYSQFYYPHALPVNHKCVIVWETSIFIYLMYKSTTFKYILIAIIASVGIGFSAFYIIAHKDALLANDGTKVTVLSSKELDSDGDTISDFDEREHGTDPYNIDTDGDGYSDNQELAGGYDPLLLQGAESRDSDQDGLNDEEERKFGTSPFLADSDFDGKEDGDEVIAGTNPASADLSYFLDISESKAQSDAILNTLNTNSKQIESIAANELGGSSIDEILGSYGGQDDLLAQVGSFDSGAGASTVGVGDIADLDINEDLIGSLESTVSSTDLSGLQAGFTNFVQGSSLEIDPLSTVETVTLPEISEDSLIIIDEYSKEDVEKYFAIVGLILSKDVPFTDGDSFEQFAVNLRLQNKDDMARVRKILGAVQKELEQVEVPRDERILNLHKKSIGFTVAAQDLVGEIENIDFEGSSSLSEITSILPRVNYLSNVVFNGEILPEIRSIVSDYELQSLISTLDLVK